MPGIQYTRLEKVRNFFLWLGLVTIVVPALAALVLSPLVASGFVFWMLFLSGADLPTWGYWIWIPGMVILLLVGVGFLVNFVYELSH